MIIYEAIEETVDIENESYRSYGVVVKDDNRTVDHLSDITLDEAAARRLANELTVNHVSPIHFRDVIEDWLSISEEDEGNNLYI